MLLHRRRQSKKVDKPKEVRIWADEQEREEMDVNHGQCVAEIEKFIDNLPNHTKTRALEIACGDGRLTVDLLAKTLSAGGNHRIARFEHTRKQPGAQSSELHTESQITRTQSTRY